MNGFKNDLKHTEGVLSMARRGDDFDSATSQFFIVLEDSEFLDGNYAAFGMVTEGMNTVDKIATVPGNRHYACAVSGSWIDENHLSIKVQVIDTYFGVLDMHFSFRDNLIGVQMVKAAEDFFGEYQGFAGGEIMC